MILICYSIFEFSFYTYERVQEIVAFIQSLVSTKPEIAIICGSGLGGLAELVKDKTVIPYADIPHFPRSTGKSKTYSVADRNLFGFFFLVVGHRSNLVFGTLNGLNVVCMQGRFHSYEGYTTATVRSFLSKIESFFLLISVGNLIIRVRSLFV